MSGVALLRGGMTTVFVARKTSVTLRLTKYTGPPSWIPYAPGCAVDKAQRPVGLQETSDVAALKSKHALMPDPSAGEQ